MPRILHVLLVLFLIQIGISEVYAQSAQIEIVELNCPDSISTNSMFVLSGHFKNTGNQEFTGTLGIEIETSGDNGSQATLLTTNPEFGTVSLDPGEELYFSTGIIISTTTTDGPESNIAIVFPKVNNTVHTMSPIFKNLVVQDPVMDGGN